MRNPFMSPRQRWNFSVGSGFVTLLATMSLVLKWSVRCCSPLAWRRTTWNLF
ncbi:hypothetical protein PC116_g22728 [Phytophthora cactorum]|nr:hypothetical protein Pcac1_g17324 [Phytophthora cactorum]KAG4228939.1 hypothetical protein PC116_g22728 [Phytophthora cactorum]